MNQTKPDAEKIYERIETAAPVRHHRNRVRLGKALHLAEAEADGMGRFDLVGHLGVAAMDAVAGWE